MTCTTQELTSLRWFNGSTELGPIYAFSSAHTFPRNIFNDSGITIDVINAIPEGLSDNFSGMSVLNSSTLALNRANIESIQCGNRMHRSGAVNLTMLNIQGICILDITFSAC